MGVDSLRIYLQKKVSLILLATKPLRFLTLMGTKPLREFKFGYLHLYFVVTFMVLFIISYEH